MRTSTNPFSRDACSKYFFTIGGEPPSIQTSSNGPSVRAYIVSKERLVLLKDSLGTNPIVVRACSSILSSFQRTRVAKFSCACPSLASSLGSPIPAMGLAAQRNHDLGS